MTKKEEFTKIIDDFTTNLIQTKKVLLEEGSGAYNHLDRWSEYMQEYSNGYDAGYKDREQKKDMKNFNNAHKGYEDGYEDGYDHASNTW